MDFEVLLSEIELKIRGIIQQNQELRNAVANLKKENEKLGKENIELKKE
jgi:regulator of replication initiation timing